MPNLAGVFDMRSAPRETAGVLPRLARVLDVPGVDYTVRLWCDERFGAVNLLTGICGNLDQPAVNPGDFVLFLDGEIANLVGAWMVVAKERGREGYPGPARACLELYQRYGDGFVESLNGQFNILLYDQRNSSVKVFNDRLAYRPFYYRCADGLALFGLEKKALFAGLGGTPPFDHMGILEFSTFGHNLGDRTIFAGVQAMPQGSVLEFRDGRATARHYWRPVYETRRGGETLDEGARELGRRLCHAIELRALGDRQFGISLSGGLDSRAVAGALARVRPNVTTFTFGADDSPDLRYGQQLSEKLGFAFCRLSYENVSRAGLLPQVVWRTEGAIPFNETYTIAEHHRMRSNAEVVLNGHFGGVLSGALLLPEQFLARDLRELSGQILAKRTMLRPQTLREVFKRSFLREAYAEMVGGIERSLGQFEEQRLPLVCNLWNMTVRARRFTFCSPAVDRYLFEQVTPFTDNDVVDWMLGMPLRHLFGQRVYKRMILQTFPGLASVPWAKTRKPLSRSFVLDMALEARLFAAKRMRRFVGLARAAGREELGDLETHVGSRLVLDAFPDELFDRDGVRRTIHAALQGTGPAVPLFVLLTFAESARLFGARALTALPPETRPLL